MNAVIKYCGIAILTQVVLAATLVLATRGSALLIVIDFYYPTIFLIAKLGGFTGESTMMLPVFFGIPLGILLYGIILGLIIKLLMRLKRFEWHD